MGSDSKWNEGYVYHGNSDKVFRDFFGGDNPYSGKNMTIKRDATQ